MCVKKIALIFALCLPCMYNGGPAKEHRLYVVLNSVWGGLTNREKIEVLAEVRSLTKEACSTDQQQSGQTTSVREAHEKLIGLTNLSRLNSLFGKLKVEELLEEVMKANSWQAEHEIWGRYLVCTGRQFAPVGRLVDSHKSMTYPVFVNYCLKDLKERAIKLNWLKDQDYKGAVEKFLNPQNETDRHSLLDNLIAELKKLDSQTSSSALDSENPVTGPNVGESAAEANGHQGAGGADENTQEANKGALAQTVLAGAGALTIVATDEPSAQRASETGHASAEMSEEQRWELHTKPELQKYLRFGWNAKKEPKLPMTRFDLSEDGKQAEPEDTSALDTVQAGSGGTFEEANGHQGAGGADENAPAVQSPEEAAATVPGTGAPDGEAQPAQTPEAAPSATQPDSPSTQVGAASDGTGLEASQQDRGSGRFKFVVGTYGYAQVLPSARDNKAVQEFRVNAVLNEEQKQPELGSQPQLTPAPIKSPVAQLKGLPYTRLATLLQILPQLSEEVVEEKLTWHEKRASNIEAGMVFVTCGVEISDKVMKVSETKQNDYERKEDQTLNQ